MENMISAVVVRKEQDACANRCPRAITRAYIMHVTETPDHVTIIAKPLTKTYRGDIMMRKHKLGGSRVDYDSLMNKHKTRMKKKKKKSKHNENRSDLIQHNSPAHDDNAGDICTQPIELLSARKRTFSFITVRCTADTKRQDAGDIPAA